MEGADFSCSAEMLHSKFCREFRFHLDHKVKSGELPSSVRTTAVMEEGGWSRISWGSGMQIKRPSCGYPFWVRVNGVAVVRRVSKLTAHDINRKIVDVCLYPEGYARALLFFMYCGYGPFVFVQHYTELARKKKCEYSGLHLLRRSGSLRDSSSTYSTVLEVIDADGIRFSAHLPPDPGSLSFYGEQVFFVNDTIYA